MFVWLLYSAIDVYFLGILMCLCDSEYRWSPRTHNVFTPSFHQL